MIDQVNVLNINIRSISKQELLEKMDKGVLVTPNLDHLVKLQKDKEFLEVYNACEWIVCDSRILLLMSKFLGRPIKEAIPGSSFFSSYCDYHKRNDEIKIFLLGAAPDVAEKAMLKINARIGRQIVGGFYSPSFGFEKNEFECRQIVNIINESNCNVLVVGVGAPKQEKWIMKYKNDLKNIDLFMALGATIDFEAGNIKRAPVLFQRLYLEWFYRFLIEPRRLWRRYFLEDPLFFWYILKQKLSFYKSPF